MDLSTHIISSNAIYEISSYFGFYKTKKFVKGNLALRWFCRVYFECVPNDMMIIL
ncbi:hypothetical protein [Ktedonospora formicarum]|uniref:Uncharacterized protein n=1 Tax=Ktedonospora formicarum TaxID=2778364 RepID=A0A8J3I2Q7_9CHLR|nr:hypothetical protein [Ktedonospora formicarum]GHO47691.1 hypothetical protein KSX_58540 [Ktedonospora formicarum]